MKHRVMTGFEHSAEHRFEEKLAEHNICLSCGRKIDEGIVCDQKCYLGMRKLPGKAAIMKERIGEAFGLIFAGLFILALLPVWIAKRFVRGKRKSDLELKCPF